MKTQKGFVGIAVALLIAVALGATGAYYYEKKTENKNSPEISDLQSQNVQDSLISGWKTYKNEKYGFEFQYPSNFYVKDQANFITLSNYSDQSLNEYQVKNGELASPTDAQSIFITIENIDNNQSLSDYLNDKKWSPHTSTQEEMVNKDVSSIKAVFESGEGTRHPITKFFLKKDNVVVSFSNSNGENYQDELNLEAQMVSTFKFDPTTSETSDWKTYKNEKYGFEISYPKSVTLQEYLGENGICLMINIAEHGIIGISRGQIPPSSVTCGGSTGRGVDDKKTQNGGQLTINNKIYSLGGWYNDEEVYGYENFGVNFSYDFNVQYFIRRDDNNFSDNVGLARKIISTLKFTDLSM